MPSDVSPNNPTYYNRKTIPQTGRIHKQKDSITRIEDEADMRYRSKFDLELAKVLMRHKVKFQYESKKFLYIPKNVPQSVVHVVQKKSVGQKCGTFPNLKIKGRVGAKKFS